jgi:hypothetical protein
VIIHNRSQQRSHFCKLADGAQRIAGITAELASVIEAEENGDDQRKERSGEADPMSQPSRYRK